LPREEALTIRFIFPAVPADTVLSADSGGAGDAINHADVGRRGGGGGGVVRAAPFAAGASLLRRRPPRPPHSGTPCPRPLYRARPPAASIRHSMTTLH